MKTYRSTGSTMIWTNATGSDVAGGDLVLVGTGVGVAVTDIADGASGAVNVAGEHEVAATTAETWTQGQVLYLDDTTHKLSNVAGDAVAGKATKAKAEDATTGLVSLTPGILDSPAAKSVVAGSLADALAVKLAALAITASAEVAHARTITVQAKDAHGEDLEARVMLDLWVNATDQDTAPTATGTDTFGAPDSGVIIQTVTDKAHYRVMTDENGEYEFVLTHNDAGSNRFIQAACQGLVATSGQIVFDDAT